MSKFSKLAPTASANFLESIYMLLPLLALPPLLHLRHFGFIAPNEEPKWILFFSVVFCLVCISAWQLFQRHWSLSMPSWRGWLLLGFTSWLAIGITFAPNWVEGLIRFDFWLAAIVIWLYAYHAAKHEPRYALWLSWSTSIAASAFCLHYWSDYMAHFGKQGFSANVTFSPIGHVNFTGDALIILLPMLIWIIITQHQLLLRLLTAFSAISVTLILFIGSSRGALGGVLLALFLLIIIALRHINMDKFRRHKRTFIFIATLPLLFYMLYAALPSHFREAGRIVQTAEALFDKPAMPLNPNVLQPPHAEFWAAAEPFLTTRTPIFASSWAMIMDKPWIGHGTGSFTYIYPAYSNHFADFRDPFSTAQLFIDNPHNIILQLMCDNGIPASIVFMLLLFWFWLTAAKQLWRQWNYLTASALMAMTAVLFDSMFNHIFINPVSMYLFALFGGFWYAHINTIETTKSWPAELTKQHARLRFTALLLPMIAIILLLFPARWLSSEWYHAHALNAFKQPQQFKTLLQQAYQADPYNPRPMFDLSQFYLHQKNAKDALPLLQSLTQIQPNNAPAWNLLGIAYIHHRQFQPAYDAFQRSLQVIPDYPPATKNLKKMNAYITKHRQVNSP